MSNPRNPDAGSYTPSAVGEHPDLGPSPVAALINGVKPAPKKKPKKAAKTSVTSHTAPASVAPVAPAPVVKTANPDLGTQGAPGPAPQQTFPSGPPIPALQRYGVNMGIQDVNQRVQDLTAAHLQQFGYKPTPSLIFDVLKAEGKTGPISYQDLFGIPKSPQEAMAQIVSRQGSGDSIGSLPVLQPKVGDLIKAMQDAVKQDTLYNYNRGDSHLMMLLKENNDLFTSAIQDPKERDKLVQGLHQVGVTRAAAEFPAMVQSASWIPRTDTIGKVASVLAHIGGAIGQIGYATANMPFGFYTMVRGLGLDSYNLGLYGIHNLMTPGHADLDTGKIMHTAHILEKMGKQIEQDVAHPIRNMGYLSMDIWGAATLGVGAYARVSRAAAAEGVVASSKALLFKAPPGASEMGFAQYHESLPLSDTAIVRVLQQHVPIVGRTARQQRLAAEMTDGFVGDERDAAAFVNRTMSTPKMLARARSKRLQIEYAVAMTPLVEMQRLARWDAAAKSVMNEVFTQKNWKDWKGMYIEQKLGVQRALHLIMSDSIDPVAEWRAYHQSQLQSLAEFKADFLHEDALNYADENDVSLEEATTELMKSKVNKRKVNDLDYSIKAHEAQLQSIDTALKIILNPPAHFRPLLDRAYQVSALQEEWKLEVSGLPEEIARQHLAEVGAKVRHENIIDLGDGLKGTTSENPALVASLIKNIGKYEERLKNAQGRLNNHKRVERLHPGTRTKEIEDESKAVKRHEDALKPLQERMNEIKNNAQPLHPAVGDMGHVDVGWLKRDAERLAKQVGTKINWRQRGIRQFNEYHPLVKEGYAVEPGVTQMHPSDVAQWNLTEIDRIHHRDASNDYISALHEIGHHVFRHVQRDTPAQRFRAEMEKLAADGHMFEAQADDTWRLEEEAEVELWAFEHSAEPMRDQMIRQGIAYIDDYIEGYREQWGAEPRLGPNLQKFEEYVAKYRQNGYPDALADIRAGTTGTAYSGPMQSERYREPGIIRNLPGVRRSRFGLRQPDFPIKAWTGKSLEMGDYRWDVTELLAEQFQMAYRAATKMTQWRDLWESAGEEPLPGHVPIRDISTIPEELRKFTAGMEKTKIDQRFATWATEAKLEELQKVLYPTAQQVIDDAIPNEHIRYVNEDLILDKIGGVDIKTWQTIDKALNNSLGIINEPMRLLLIFGTPAYMLNALGSAALLMIHTGPMSIGRLGRAMGAEHFYGGEATRILDRLAGDTHAVTLATEKAWYTKGSQYAASFWARATDTYFRRAAVIHELKRHGLLDEKMTPDEITSVLQDPANSAKVSQAAQTARKAMLDFNSLTWPERAVMRHLFFVYSFVRSSGIWSLRFLRDHGVLSDTLAQSGREREQNIEDLVGHMPDWFMRAGYFAVHPDTIYNPIQWNMPGMLEQIGAPLSAIFGHTPYANAAELLGPGAVMASEIVTGHDAQGQPLPGNGGSLEGSFLDQWRTTPWGQLGQKAAKERRAKAHPLKPEQIRSGFADPISPALEHERSGLNQSVFENDGFWNTWGLALFRSAVPRAVNPVAGEARYWRDLRQTDIAAYHKHELDAVAKMVKRQEQVVGQHAPPDVIRAVDTIAHVSQAIEDYKLAHRGEPTPNQKQVNEITITTLAKEGHIKNKAEWLKRNKDAVDPAEISSIQVEALYAGGGLAWKQWIDQVNKIDKFAQPSYDGAVEHMSDLGLGDFKDSAKAPNETRWAYGRKALDLLSQSKQLSQKVGAASGDAKNIAQQEWIRFVNAHDNPITVNGHTFPSPFQYDFATRTPPEQRKALASYSKRRPSQLTAFQVQLLTGTRPDPVVTLGWETLSKQLQQNRSALSFGKNLPSTVDSKGNTISQRQYYGDLLASRSPEFKKAWDFERQPLSVRMQSYQPITNSPNASNWQWLLQGVASSYRNYASQYKTENGGVNMKLVKEAWARSVPDLVPIIHQRSPNGGFTSELRIYTGATSDENADAYLEKFLNRLISP